MMPELKSFDAHVPSLDEVAVVLKEGLIKHFEDVEADERRVRLVRAA